MPREEQTEEAKSKDKPDWIVDVNAERINTPMHAALVACGIVLGTVLNENEVSQNYKYKPRPCPERVRCFPHRCKPGLATLEAELSVIVLAEGIQATARY